MSTILEALRKVEAQRDVPPTADVGGLHETRTPAAIAPTKSGARRIATVGAAVGLSALAGVLVTLGALSLWQNQADSAAQTTVAVAGAGDGVTPPVAAPTATRTQEVSRPPPSVAAAGVEIASEPRVLGNRDVVVVSDVLAARERAAAAAADTSLGGLDETPTPGTSSRAFDPESDASLARLEASREARVSNVAVVAPSSTPPSTSPPSQSPSSAKQSPSDVAKPTNEERIAVRSVVKAPAEVKPSQVERQRPAAESPAVTEAVRPVIARGDAIEEIPAATIPARVAETRAPRPPPVAVAKKAIAKPAIEAPLPRATVTKPAPTTVQVAAISQPRESGQGAPGIAVLGTKWHPRVDRRSAEVTLSEGGGTRTIEVRQGQRVGSLEVVEIAPTGVTFRHNGAEIKRRVGAGPG